MRISDWSSDVCSSDLRAFERALQHRGVGVDGHRDQRGLFRGGRDVGGLRRRDVGDGLALATGQRRRDQHYGTQDVESAHESAPWLGVLIPPGRPKRSMETLRRSEEHTSELQSLMRISYAVFRLHKNTNK